MALNPYIGCLNLQIKSHIPIISSASVLEGDYANSKDIQIWDENELEYKINILYQVFHGIG